MLKIIFLFTFIIHHTITLLLNGERIVEERAVAEAFNEYFITKVYNIKESIDPICVEVPRSQ